MVIRQGDPGNVMYFIAAGKLEVKQGGQQGPAGAEERQQGLPCEGLAVEHSEFSHLSDGASFTKSK